jgi:hypothetical protein
MIEVTILQRPRLKALADTPIEISCRHAHRSCVVRATSLIFFLLTPHGASRRRTSCWRRTPCRRRTPCWRGAPRNQSGSRPPPPPPPSPRRCLVTHTTHSAFSSLFHIETCYTAGGAITVQPGYDGAMVDVDSGEQYCGSVLSLIYSNRKAHSDLIDMSAPTGRRAGACVC